MDNISEFFTDHIDNVVVNAVQLLEKIVNSETDLEQETPRREMNEITSRHCRVCLRSSGDADRNHFVDLSEATSLSIDAEADEWTVDILTCFKFCTKLEVTAAPRTRFHHLCRECVDALRTAYKFITKAILSDQQLMDFKREQIDGTEFTDLDLIEALEEESLGDTEEECSKPEAVLQENLAAIFGTDDLETEFIVSDFEEGQEDAVSLALNKESTVADDNASEQREVELIGTLYSNDEDSQFIQLEQIKAEEEHDGKRILVKFVDSDDEEGNVDGVAQQRGFDFNCELCTDKFCMQRELLQHYNKDHDDLDMHFACDLCASHFINKNALRIHKRQVHENSEYRDCQQCGRYVLKSFFNLHKRRHKSKLQFLCSECPSTFTTKYVLHKHMTARHTEKRVRNIACADCDRKFFTVEHLQVHRVVHESKPRVLHTCTLCPKTFIRQANLKLHMQMHRGQTMDCPHCGKQFVRRKDLEIHVRFHTGETPYACDSCDKRFAIKSHLTTHERRHRGIRYECSCCNKVFMNVSGLQQHSFEHTGMPLSCSICQRGFPTKFKMRRHLRSVHPNLFTGDDKCYSDALADRHITTNTKPAMIKREYAENATGQVEEEEDSIEMELEMLEEHINPDLI